MSKRQGRGSRSTGVGWWPEALQLLQELVLASALQTTYKKTLEHCSIWNHMDMHVRLQLESLLSLCATRSYIWLPCIADDVL